MRWDYVDGSIHMALCNNCAIGLPLCGWEQYSRSADGTNARPLALLATSVRRRITEY
jgi:hypothetical protein